MFRYVRARYNADPLLAVNNLAPLLFCCQPYFLYKQKELELKDVDINTVLNKQGLNKSTKPAYLTCENYLWMFN
jgi:hypothetical protein